MKRITAFVLAAVLMCSLCGCAPETTKKGTWISFYYCREDMSSYVPDSVITQELRQISDDVTDLIAIMDLYLQGPRAPELKNVFPPNCRVVRLTVEEEVSEVCLSKEIGQLEGMNLTVACACFAKTLMELSGTKILRIRGDKVSLAGLEYVEMHYGNLVFDDESAVATEPTEP